MTLAMHTHDHSHDHDHAPTRSDLESLARVWALAGPLRGRVAIGLLFRFAQSLALGLAFGVVVWTVTSLADGRAMTSDWAWQITGLMLLSLVAQIGFAYLAVSFSWLSSYLVAGDVRLSMLDHLRKLPMGFHLSRHKGDTVTALTSDMQMIESFLSDALPKIAQAFGLPIVVFVFLLFRDWVVALSAMASIVVAMPVFVWSSKKLSQLGLRRQDIQAAAAARMIEFAQGIAVIRAFNQIAKGQESFEAALRAFRDISITMVVKLVVPIIAFAAIMMLGAPLVIVVGALRYFGAEISLGTLISVLVLLFSIYAPLLALVSIMEVTRMADASLTRMDRITTGEPLPEPESPRQPEGFAVRFEDVQFGYLPDTPVLRGVSFTVPERTMTAIVGPSGSGKSTILNLLPRFWDVAGGTISIGGVDIREMTGEVLNGLITVVFQDVYLFAGTIFDNIAFGRPGASREEVEAAARAAQAHDFIMALPGGYQTKVGEGGAMLSGGERQRVSIARAILKNAPIVLLDEATAAIDPTNEKAIQLALSRLVADKTLIVVAHKLSTIQAADQILALESGRIVERGEHADLLVQDGLYARLWSHRARAAGWHLGADTPQSAS